MTFALVCGDSAIMTVRCLCVADVCPGVQLCSDKWPAWNCNVEHTPLPKPARSNPDSFDPEQIPKAFPTGKNRAKEQFVSGWTTGHTSKSSDCLRIFLCFAERKFWLFPRLANRQQQCHTRTRLVVQFLTHSTQANPQKHIAPLSLTKLFWWSRSQPSRCRCRLKNPKYSCVRLSTLWNVTNPPPH